jgi:mRNA interferase RelE/StbE
MYTVQVSKRASQEIAKLGSDLQSRVVARLEALAEDPRPPGCKKLAGSDYWRIRIGEYRAVYSIQDQQLLVLVIHVAHRREVYR